jgi:hypothetical protein
VHLCDAPFPSYFPKSLDFEYFNSVTYFKSVFSKVKFDFSLFKCSLHLSSNFFLLFFLFAFHLVSLICSS